MKRIAILLFILVGTSWSQFGHAANERLVLTGSSSVAPLVLEIARQFESENKNIRVDVQTGGSSRGINDARRGLADIGMVSRALKSTEQDLTSHTIARDGIGIILHKSNPVHTLTNKQIIRIYTGEIENWHELGGSDLPITVINKAEGRSTLELFLKYFSLKNSQIKAHVIIGDNQQGIKVAAGNPGAIGYVSIGAAEYEEERGVPIRRLSMSGIAASVAQVQSGDFPLSRPLNLVVKGAPTPLMAQFIEYAQSEKVHDLVRAQFLVPVGP